MRKLDVILRDWRISKALRHVRSGDRLLDIGCFDGHLIRCARGHVSQAVGLDPLVEPGRRDGVQFIRDTFPAAQSLEDGGFDSITMLAVLEHMGDPDRVARECYRILKPAGRVILTVPSPLVDHVLSVLECLRLVDGMCTDQHHGFDVRQTAAIFESAGFCLKAWKTFQLGLNNLFVFEKPARNSEVQAATLAGLQPA